MRVASSIVPRRRVRDDYCFGLGGVFFIIPPLRRCAASLSLAAILDRSQRATGIPERKLLRTAAIAATPLHRENMQSSTCALYSTVGAHAICCAEGRARVAAAWAGGVPQRDLARQQGYTRRPPDRAGNDPDPRPELACCGDSSKVGSLTGS
jgi:hypothetical protein